MSLHATVCQCATHTIWGTQPVSIDTFACDHTGTALLRTLNTDEVHPDFEGKELQKEKNDHLVRGEICEKNTT